MNEKKFDQAIYWRQRVTGDIDLGVVGHQSLGRAYNQYIYRRRLEVLLDTLKSLNLDPSQLNVLDIGCGSGFYIDFWQQLGVPELTGIDISQQSVDRIQLRHPNYTFSCIDITACDTPKFGHKFSLVTIFDVLYHITDDIAAEMALMTASNALAENGYLFIFDQLLDHDYSLRPHVKFRSRRKFNLLLQQANLKLISTQKLFVLLEPPIVGSRPVDYFVAGTYWLAGSIMRRFVPLGHIIGKSVYSIDRALRKIGIESANHELIIAVKQS